MNMNGSLCTADFCERERGSGNRPRTPPPPALFTPPAPNRTLPPASRTLAFLRCCGSRSPSVFRPPAFNCLSRFSGDQLTTINFSRPWSQCA